MQIQIVGHSTGQLDQILLKNDDGAIQELRTLKSHANEMQRMIRDGFLDSKTQQTIKGIFRTIGAV